MQYERYLNSFINFESNLQHAFSHEFDLDRVRRLFENLGNPQKNLKFIHVAGTKGKGSTCAFIAHILQAAGYRVGLYTSPHLYKINERIRVLTPGSRNISKDFFGSITDGEFDALIKTLKPKLEKARRDPLSGNLTYFEILTGLALYYFAKKKTDLVVLEVGLGGRLDATNVVDSIVDVITPVSFDHTHLLGNTLDKIALEKAAIIKNRSSRVVIGRQHDKAMRVILKQCRSFSIRPVLIGRDVTYVEDKTDLHGQSFYVCGRMGKYQNLKTVLPGEHQLQNAATAVGVVESLSEFGMSVSKKAVIQGIRQARWPARFEIINSKPMTIIDGAHNVDSAQVLVQTFKSLFPGKKAILILGMSQDKDIAGICRVLGKIAQTVILTRAAHPRAHDFKSADCKKLFKINSVIYCPLIKDAIAQANKSARKSGVILSTGSLFLAAQVRAMVNHVSI
jgi:dihydrofolate synthase/folylpolyglutamate synthase